MDLDFYTGFEGEIEYFIQHRPADSSPVQTIRLWMGDFDAIMERVAESAGGHRGIIKRYYSFGWLDDEPWSDPDVSGTLALLSSLEPSDVEPTRVRAILEVYIALLRRALHVGGEVVVWTE